MTQYIHLKRTDSSKQFFWMTKTHFLGGEKTTKPRFWMLKMTLYSRRFFLTSKSYVLTEIKDNNNLPFPVHLVYNIVPPTAH